MFAHTIKTDSKAKEVYDNKFTFGGLIFSIIQKEGYLDVDVTDGARMIWCTVIKDHQTQKIKEILNERDKLKYFIEQFENGGRRIGEISNIKLIELLAKVKMDSVIKQSISVNETKENQHANFDSIMTSITLQYMSDTEVRNAIETIKYLRTKYVLSSGLTPLHYAAQYNNVELAKALVEQLNENILAGCKNGITPFHIARNDKLRAFFASKLSIEQPEAGYLKLHHQLYKATKLNDGHRKVFLLENDRGEKFVARELPIKKSMADETGVREAYYYNRIARFKPFGGSRIFTQTHPDSCFVLSAYIPGKPLAEYSDKDVMLINFAPIEFINVLLAAADAVNWIHKDNVVHCDLNPTNMILSERRVRLIDFELMCAEGEYQPITNKSFIKIANPYATFSTDIYGLGITFATIYLTIVTMELSASEQVALKKLNDSRLQSLLLRITGGESKDTPSLNEIMTTLKAISTEEAKDYAPFAPDSDFIAKLRRQCPPITCQFALKSSFERADQQIQPAKDLAMAEDKPILTLNLIRQHSFFKSETPKENTCREIIVYRTTEEILGLPGARAL